MTLDPELPVWALAACIFLLRVADVSLGTVRTIVVVHGRIRLSVLLGFVEVLVWITAVSQVILRLRESPVLVVAYAAGFATGNAVGILLERRLALGHCVVRMISREGEAVARVLVSFGRVRPSHDTSGSVPVQSVGPYSPTSESSGTSSNRSNSAAGRSKVNATLAPSSR